MTKTIQELRQQIACDEVVDKQRDISDKRYARREFEKAIVWFFALLIAGAVAIAINGWIRK